MLRASAWAGGEPRASSKRPAISTGTGVAHTVRMIRRVLPVLLVTGLAVACGTAEDVDDASQDAVVAGGMNAKATDPCTATLVFLQKDAYKPTGRSNELWPPHTTTVLEVSCQTAKGEQHIAPYKENYGTKPGAKDAQGNDMLSEAKMDPEVVTVKAPWSQMSKLVESYQGCGCDPKGFLGLDTIDVEGKGLVESFAPLLSCPDSEDALLGALKQKKFGEAKAMLERCKIKDDLSPESATRALGDIESQVKKLYSDHHLCNNNAELQADLFVRFRDHKDAKACDPHNRDLCYGPKLFFNPAKEIH